MNVVYLLINLVAWPTPPREHHEYRLDARARAATPDRRVTAGSQASSSALAIGRGADLRVYTEFRFEEHIAPGGDGHPDHDGLIREVIDFRETILDLEGRHTAAVTTLRQPLEPPFRVPTGPGRRCPYFLYQSDGRPWRCANVLLDHVEGAAETGRAG